MLPIVICPLRRLGEGEDIVQDTAIFDKACLCVMDWVQEEWPYLSTNHFGEDFVSCGEEGDRPPLSDLLMVSPFGDKVDEA